ncbi:MAG: IS5 family transposase [Betaproteobacteria bacterium]|nr:IS5 family transposase [Betaproteobacteria bacterium]
MRGADITQIDLFSYRTLEERIPASHPLRKLRLVVDAILGSMDGELDGLYADLGRVSIPPERLLRASLLQTLFSIRSERQLVAHIDYNLLYRWFVGLEMDEEVWNHSTFSANRDRLLNEAVARLFFRKVLALAEWQGLVSDEHFSVDGTLIEAWASMKSFVKKDGTTPPPEGGGRNPTVVFKGETRSNDTHQSTTDPDARLYKKSEGDKSRLCYLGHALMENRNGLAVDVETTHASGTAEREAAKTMMIRSIRKGRSTLGADKGYDVHGFVQAVRDHGVSPHVAKKAKGSAVDGRTTRHPGYKTSLIIRKRIEEIFGWAKTVGGLRKARFTGLSKVRAQTTFTFAAYNLTRMAAILGWRWSTA